MITVIKRTGTPRLSPGTRSSVEEALAGLLRRHGKPSAEITLLLTSDDEMKRLNREWFGRRGTTDVISFAYSEGPEAGMENYLGDIAVSLDAARRQAGEIGHSFRREVVILACHGLLHILGYDDATPEGAQEMMEISLEASLNP